MKGRIQQTKGRMVLFVRGWDGRRGEFSRRRGALRSIGTFGGLKVGLSAT